MFSYTCLIEKYLQSQIPFLKVSKLNKNVSETDSTIPLNVPIMLFKIIYVKKTNLDPRIQENLTLSKHLQKAVSKPLLEDVNSSLYENSNMKISKKVIKKQTQPQDKKIT